MTFATAEIIPWGWLLARAGGFMIIWPLTGGGWVPARAKMAVALVLTILGGSQIQPSWAEAAGDQVLGTLMGEFFIGFFMGFGVRLVFVILEVGGHIIAMEMGLAMAQSFNPASNSTATVIETFAYFWGLCLAVVTGWYRESIGYWVLSYQFYPPGEWTQVMDGIAGLPRVFAHVFTMGVQMSAPVMAIIILLNLTFAFLGKVAPQVNVLMLSFSVRIIFGLFALVACVLLARALFLEASSWMLPYTVQPSILTGAR
ncbi:MAG: flagellar biosynthetic protein FliR [Opitutales bacterium]